jgi:hypothetical protein
MLFVAKVDYFHSDKRLVTTICQNPFLQNFFFCYNIQRISDACLKFLIIRSMPDQTLANKLISQILS